MSAVVAGAGAGLGRSLAASLAGAGEVAAIARRAPSWPGVLGIAADLGDAAAVDTAFGEIEARLGPVDRLVYNAGELVLGSLLDTPPAVFERLWRTHVLGAVHCLHRVVPSMRAAGRGAIGFVGATGSVRGGARSAAFASSKFALRGLAQSSAREFGPAGVHVVHVVIDAALSADGAPGTLRSDQVADTIVATLDQPATAGWTFELDLRAPAGTW